MPNKTCAICKKSFKESNDSIHPLIGEALCSDCIAKFVIPTCIQQITKESKNAILFREDGKAEIISPKGEYFTLEELQHLVGGYIEIYPARYLDHLIVCDEEGLIKKRKLNVPFKALTTIGLVGNVLLCPERIFEEPEKEDES